MFGLSGRASTFWVLVLAGALVSLALSLTHVGRDFHLWLPALLFTLGGAIAETFEVAMPTTRPGNRYTITVGACVFIAAIMLFPTAWAVLIVTVSALLGRRGIWFKRLFNTAHTTLACGVAALVWSQRDRALSLTASSVVPRVMVM